MLPRPSRLTRRRDFDLVFKKGRTVSDAALSLRFVRTPSPAPCRMAFIVSAKTEKSAVKRNRAKRQAREILRKALPHLPPGTDIALTIKRPFLKLDYQQKRTRLQDLFWKAKLA